MLYSLGVILAIFIATTVVMDQLHASENARGGAYIIIATMILATIIWNAVSRAVVEIHALL